MILSKLTMKNFRQFRGTQHIEFAYDLGGNGKNVTVIFGENGRGKTSIFRAIMFCLYAEHRLSQDSRVDEKELYLVNYPEMERAACDNKKPVDCFVELEFSHKGTNYTLRRSILGMLDEGEVIQQPGDVLLVQRTKDGNAITMRNPNEIDKIINDILDRGIREYFLFDGEKIERLTRASSEQRKEISRGLRNLLNIDTLETAIKATGRLKRTLDAELERRSTGEFGRLIKQLRENEDRRTELEEKITRLEKEIDLAEQEKRRVDKELDKIREIRDLLDARDNLEARENDLGNQAKSLLLDMGTRTGKASLLLVKKSINRVFDHVDQRKQNREIPSEIRKDLIERILSEKKCICGREISTESEAFSHIIRWKNRTTDVATEDSMLNLWRCLSNVKSHFGDVVMNIETILQRYALVKNDIETTRKKLKDINNKIASSERADAAKLEKHRQNIESKRIKLETEYSKIKEELAILKEEYTKLSHQREEREREEGIKNELSKRATLALRTYDALESVHNEFTQEIKKVIGESATGLFQELIDKESQKTLSQIVVDDDYSLQILDRGGRPFLANISAGQRQIMSIAFIVALAKAAAKGEMFEMPLFMDTPFGRLSYEHRKNLLQSIPGFASQWILLATDTEFRKQEAELLKQGRQWGKFYLLKGQGAGTTLINELDVANVFTVLREDMEG